MKKTDAIQSFSRLGRFLQQFAANTFDAKASEESDTQLSALNRAHASSFEACIREEHIHNPWFTDEAVRLALSGIAKMLRAEVLEKWLKAYTWPDRQGKGLNIGLVLAGNIPLVGFHDLLCVLITGNRALVKTSGKDDRLIRRIAGILSDINPAVANRICFIEDRLTACDAVIATGSNNSARYFEYYFRNMPHIIRKNRNSVAVLSGTETDQELELLGHDIFDYFGLGCRNVTKLYIPIDYELKNLLGVLDRFVGLAHHHKYANNVDYHRALYLMNQDQILDNGVLLLKEDRAIASPPGVVFYERYTEIEKVKKVLKSRAEEIQCCISLHPAVEGGLKPGDSQVPMPWDYADGIDTMNFLSRLA